jgi:hypothetical protein
MARYDAILADVIKRIEDLAAERITLERDYLTAEDVEDEGELYQSEFIVQEQRFGLIVTELRALLFGDLDEIKEQYEPKLKARAEFGASQLLHPKKRGTFTLAEVLPDGPVQSYDDHKARLNAAEAREEKVRAND